jgi:bifunctional non-homologous end joining protein LigD
VDYKPQLATLVKAPPAGDEWLHEIKYDGYRMGCAIAARSVRLTSRNGQDYTSALPEIVADAKKLGVRSALVDGEVVVLLHDGRASFQALQQAMASPSARAGLVYLAFDLLEIDGESLLNQPLEARKARLQALVGDGRAPRIRYSDHVVGHGSAFYEQAQKLGVEGIVSKRRDSVYQPGRRAGWLKIKCLREQPFVIGGYTDQEGMQGGLGALLVGYYMQGRLTFAGRVGTGFTQKSAAALLSQLTARARRTSPFDPPPAGPLAKSAHFVEPELVCRVAFAEWTDDERIRHPVFHGLAAGIAPADIRRDGV